MAVGTGFDIAFPTCRPAHPRREMFIFSVMGRLKPGWSIAQASEYFAALSPGLFAATAPDGYSAQALKTFTSFRLAAYPAGSGVSSLRDAYDSPLRLLLAITGLVLLIACANLANLMLARASVRQREMAMRKALGATPRRLLRQMLIESGLLAAMGAGLGIALAQPLSRILVTTLSSSQNAIQLNIATDWRVLLFATAVATLTCLLFAVVPALRSAGANPLTSIRSGERGVVSHRERTSLQRFMVITQIAVSMVLLVGALLFVRSYRNLVTLDPGMRESGVTIGYFGFGTFKIKPENLAAFKRQLVDEIRTVPGVQNAAATTNIPLNGGSWSHGVLVGTTEGSSRFTYASPTYFATMNIPLISGRSFTAADTTNAPFVLIVNQSFVRHFLAGVDPIGQLVHVHEEPQYPARTYQIIGTIADTRYQDLRTDLQPIAFVPIDQLPVTAQGPGAAMLIASTDPGAINAIRHDLNAKYPGMLMEFADFQQNIRDTLIGDRMMAMLSGFFGVLAALLVVIGLYGVLSYLIAQRRNEIGLRIALGARRWQVIALVLRNTAAMSLIGILTGAGLALLAARGAGSMLFGLSASDPATLIASALILAFIAILASWIPARSASRLDPLAALRSE